LCRAVALALGKREVRRNGLVGRADGSPSLCKQGGLSHGARVTWQRRLETRRWLLPRSS
jgi:hypothetical protein